MTAPRILAVQPLTRAAFAPYGDVIETEGLNAFPINEGTALRFNDLAMIDVSKEGGDRKSTRLNSSHIQKSRMPSSA